ncbi:MAG: hypothetical protein O3A51_00295 [Verrucomicrobia bacterium]|nr:hypothetical protein [Verrucomicrobiota bacterium]
MKRIRQNSRLRLWGWVSAITVLAIVAMAGDVPFMEPFDDNPDARLHNYRTWQARRQQDAQTQQSVVFAGTKAAVIATNALLSQPFSDVTATNVWVDFYGWQHYPTSNVPPELQGSIAASFFVGADGMIRATSNSTWVTLNYTVPSNSWRRFTVNLDYVSSIWSLGGR